MNNVLNLTHVGLNKLLKQYKIKGFNSKTKPFKQQVLALASYSDETLSKIAKKNYNIKKEKTRQQLISLLIKGLKENTLKLKQEKLAIGKDKLILYDSLSGTKAYRVISKIPNNIQSMVERVQEYDRDFDKKGYTLLFVTVFFQKIGNKKSQVYQRSAKTEEFEDVDTFQKWLELILTDPERIKTGSEGFVEPGEEGLYFPIFNKFNLVVNKKENITDGYGGKVNMFYKTIEVEKTGKNMCGYDCLKHIIPELTKKEFQEKKLQFMTEMFEYITNKDLNVAIVGNYINYTDYIEYKDLTKEVKDKNGRIKKFKKLEINNVKPIFMFGMEPTKEYDYYIIYDLDKKHYELSEELELDNIYVNKSRQYFKINKKNIEPIVVGAQNYNNLIKYKAIVDNNETIDIEYIFFDYETVVDWKIRNVNKPYSLAILHLTKSELLQLEKYETENKKEEGQELIDRKSRIFLGFNCSKRFFEYIEENQADKVFYLIGFNNANFDNYILYSDAMKNNIQCGQPLINNGQLLTMKIMKRHTLWDIRKHVVGSLKDNCKGYGIKNFAKVEGFSHVEMQQKYDEGVLKEFINENAKLAEYNIMDCASLAVLFQRYKKTISEIKGFEDKKVEEFLTLGHLVNTKLKEHCKKNGINFTKFHINNPKEDIKIEKKNKRLLQYYKDIQDDRVAGRVQLFHDVIKIIGKMYSMDVCSLYPFVMLILNCVFPTGEIIECTKYDDKPKNKIGFFYCDVDQSNLQVKIVAKKTKDGNDWDKSKINNVFLSSIMIEYLIENKCEIKIRNGIYFSETIKNYKLFEFLLPVMNMKNQEDKLKEEKSVKYNSALRETSKLILNILSGKLNQSLTLEDRKTINSYDFIDIVNKGEVDKINTIYMNGKQAHITYKIDEEEAIKNSKPLNIGSLIYDYAKIYMHKNIYTKTPFENMYYTDTDSCKMDEEGFKVWSKYASKQIVPHWEAIEEYDERFKTHKMYNPKTKVFGSYENEYDGCPMNVHYFMQKKMYLSTNKEYNLMTEKERKEYLTENKIDEKKLIKMSAKGISSDNVIIKDLDSVEDLSNEELCEIFNAKDSKRIRDNYMEFFETLYTKKTANVLCFSMQRKSGNTKKGVIYGDEERTNKDCYKILSLYRTKTINIKI